MQENNINTREKVDNSTVQMQNQSISARTKKDTTIDNEAQNAGKLLSKIAQCNPNQCGKKDKTVHAMQKEFAESDSSKKGLTLPKMMVMKMMTAMMMITTTITKREVMQTIYPKVDFQMQAQNTLKPEMQAIMITKTTVC